MNILNNLQAELKINPAPVCRFTLAKTAQILTSTCNLEVSQLPLESAETKHENERGTAGGNPLEFLMCGMVIHQTISLNLINRKVMCGGSLTFNS